MNNSKQTTNTLPTKENGSEQPRLPDTGNATVITRELWLQGYLCWHLLLQVKQNDALLRIDLPAHQPWQLLCVLEQPAGILIRDKIWTHLSKDRYLLNGARETPKAHHLTFPLKGRYCLLFIDLPADKGLELLEKDPDSHTLPNAILESLAKTPLPEPDATTDEGIQDTINYIKRNYYQSIIIKDLCKMARMNITSFEKHFKKATGLSPIEYIQQHRVEQAVVLLRTTKQPIREIALSTGFSGPSYFCEVFKKYYHCSPLQYRKAHQQ